MSPTPVSIGLVGTVFLNWNWFINEFVRLFEKFNFLVNLRLRGRTRNIFPPRVGENEYQK